ncbi:hypothetical protein [Enterococcus wangshanyuanii]|uniref:DUF3021 domain-containing protein n=1 Tax=Enterococcus wangshanyuanii TaxID=2005703 RepID=A0ABQ1PRK5_9ENTE|nr:hypothetical protein [Enterococcus wangshanyuanii]GGD02048.1 hypothetical protein GCM10011573_34430 [Enterococcus wangshanyuanii]
MFILNELFSSVGLLIKLVVNFVLAALLYPIQVISSFLMNGAIQGDFTEGGSTFIILSLLFLLIGACLSLIGYVIKGGFLLFIVSISSVYVLGLLVCIFLFTWLISKIFKNLDRYKSILIAAFKAKVHITKNNA